MVNFNPYTPFDRGVQLILWLHSFLGMMQATTCNTGVATALALTLLDEGLVKDGPEGGVQLFPYILQENRGAKLDCVFQRSEKIWLLEVNHL